MFSADLGVVAPVQVGLEAALEPPRPVVVFCAVVVKARVVVAVVRRERLVVVVLAQSHRVARIAPVTVHMQSAMELIP